MSFELTMTKTISMLESTHKKIREYMDKKALRNYSHAARNLINLGYAKFLEMEWVDRERNNEETG